MTMWWLMCNHSSESYGTKGFPPCWMTFKLQTRKNFCQNHPTWRRWRNVHTSNLAFHSEVFRRLQRLSNITVTCLIYHIKRRYYVPFRLNHGGTQLATANFFCKCDNTSQVHNTAQHIEIWDLAVATHRSSHIRAARCGISLTEKAVVWLQCCQIASGMHLP